MGAEQEWLDGWLLRAGHGSTYRATSAVPLDSSASLVLAADLPLDALPGAAVRRAAVTTAPDSLCWAGLSAVHVVDGQRRRGHARDVCAALLGWAGSLCESMGFAVHHRSRYVDARTL